MRRLNVMSAIPPKADIRMQQSDVRFVPEAEVAAIRSMELIVQPDAKDVIDEMRVCGDWPPSHTTDEYKRDSSSDSDTRRCGVERATVFNATPGSFWTNVKVGRLQAAALLILK
jgi:hypothetical protein